MLLAPAGRRRAAPSLPDASYVAVLGGSETCARGLAAPYPTLLERQLGVPCVNLGQLNGSVDAVLSDDGLVRAARGAALRIVTITGAMNLSNRLYSVHPRRNDRFLKPSPALRVLFPEVDFAEVCFTRHLLLLLHDAAPDRVAIVRDELRLAWAARMRLLLDRIGGPVLLLWLASDAPKPVDPIEEEALGPDPIFVTVDMVEAVRPLVAGLVTVASSELRERPELAHAAAAEALLGPVQALLPPLEAARALA